MTDDQPTEIKLVPREGTLIDELVKARARIQKLEGFLLRNGLCPKCGEIISLGHHPFCPTESPNSAARKST